MSCFSSPSRSVAPAAASLISTGRPAIRVAIPTQQLYAQRAMNPLMRVAPAAVNAHHRLRAGQTVLDIAVDRMIDAVLRGETPNS